MQALLPRIECRSWSNPRNPDDIEIAIIWKPPLGDPKRFSNLKLIVSIGAGIDHVLIDSYLPHDMPIMRATGEDLKIRMRGYAPLQVFRLHRRLPEIEAAEARQAWLQLVNPPAYQRKVSILGMGDLGGACARSMSSASMSQFGRGGPKPSMAFRALPVTNGSVPFLNTPKFWSASFRLSL